MKIELKETEETKNKTLIEEKDKSINDNQEEPKIENTILSRLKATYNKIKNKNKRKKTKARSCSTNEVNKEYKFKFINRIKKKGKSSWSISRSVLE